MSMGDTSVIASVEYLTDGEQIMFWTVLMVVIVVNNIIFLNFIVAQAGSTYNNVSE